MKILNKQIKITNIGKYIKKNDLRWLIFLLAPLVIGLIVHFTIPVSFVLNANPSAEQSYNHKKISLQLNTVRSLSLLNAQMIRKNMQRFQNIRNFLIRIFGQTNPYETINFSQIILNNAIDIANTVKNGGDITNISQRSMWYAQGVTQFSDLNPVQQFIYGEYLSVQPFIQSQFLNINNSTQQAILKGLSLSANFSGQGLYFQFPSKFNSNYLDSTSSSYDVYFNKTIYNYVNSNGSFQYTISSEQINGQNQLVICNVVFSNQFPVGVACFYVVLADIALQLTSNLGIPNISYSTTSYYLLAPIYPISQLIGKKESPQIIFNFTDKNSQNINYPLNDYLNLSSNFPPHLYSPQGGVTSANYSYYVSFQNGNLIYMQVPINIYTYLQDKQTILFLLVEYNFQSSVFNSIAKYSQILKDLSIPSVIVIIASTIISLVVLKCLLNNLDDQLHKINDNCQFMLHGDLDLKISQYQDTEQLKQVYKNLKIINCLHQFSTPEYFNDTEEKKIVKLYKALQTFNELDYPTDTLLENIGDSYMMLGEIFKAIQFLKKSYEKLIEQVQELFEQSLQDILRLKHQQSKKLSKRYRRYELKIIGRLFKLILLHNIILNPPPTLSFQKKNQQNVNSNYQKNKLIKTLKKYQVQYKKYLSIFKQLAYPNFITSQSMFVYLFQARFQIQKNNYKAAKIILKRFQRIMSEYGNDFDNLEQGQKGDSSPVKNYQQLKNNISAYCKVSPTIMWSAFYFMEALTYYEQPVQERNITQQINSFKKSVNGNFFSQDIHLRVITELIKISHEFRLQSSFTKKIMSSFIYFKQIFPLYHIQQQNFTLLSRLKKYVEKQVLFMFDCSNKWMASLEQFRKWQKQTRQISLNIFNILSPEDRTSIMKVNSTVLIQTCCNLTYKHHNQSLILKQLSNAIKLKYMSGRCKIIKALHIAVNRIKKLEENKYLVIFLKEGKQEFQKEKEVKKQKKLKKMSSSSNEIFQYITVHNFNSPNKLRKNTEISPAHKPSVHSKADSYVNSFEQEQQVQERNSMRFSDYYRNLREDIISVLLMPEVHNLNLILIIQNAQAFKRMFNLGNVNEVLQQEYLKRDKSNNNLLYVIDSQNSDQIERIFVRKTLKRQQSNIVKIF